MHKLTNWSARRSGPSMTVKGQQPNGTEAKLPNVKLIEVKVGRVVATDTDGNEHELQVGPSGTGGPAPGFPINALQSDLFFNSDLSSAKQTNAKGEFTGWNEEELLELAQTMILRLKGLGVPQLLTAADLVQDFYDRV
jgi:hypothetical protein